MSVPALITYPARPIQGGKVAAEAGAVTGEPFAAARDCVKTFGPNPLWML